MERILTGERFFDAIVRASGAGRSWRGFLSNLTANERRFWKGFAAPRDLLQTRDAGSKVFLRAM